MLHNPQWDQKTDPLTLDAVIAWLEKQPANDKYEYCNSMTCLAAQYNASIGRSYDPPGIPLWAWERLYAGKTAGVDFDRVLEFIAAHADRTFGDALRIAKWLRH